MDAIPASSSTLDSMPIPARLPWLYSAFQVALPICCILAALLLNGRQSGDIMIRTFLWAGLALSWNIAGGYTGLISFGHAAFFAIGAYTSTILLLSYEITPWAGMLVGALLAGVAGALITAVCARLRGPFFILSTLATGEVVRIAALNWRSLTGGSEGLEIPPVPSFSNMVFAGHGPYLALMLAYMFALFGLSLWIERSRFGYYLFASRDDEDGAAAIGVNPGRMRVLAMALSAALSAIGGSLFAQYFLYLDPTHIVSPDISFQFALVCAIGGLGTAIGPIAGAIIVIPLSELLRGWLSQSASGLHLVIYGLAVTVVMLYFPAGIAGAVKHLSLSVQSRRALRAKHHA